MEQAVEVGSSLVSFKVAQLCPTLCDPMDCIAHQAPLSMEFCWQEYCRGLQCLPPGDLPNPGMEPRCPACQADPLPAETPGKPKNTGVGSRSRLQGIFPTQESNPGLLHCRQILYYLSHQGSPLVHEPPVLSTHMASVMIAGTHRAPAICL